jgi:hydroxymethylbilane synthase
MGGSCSMPLAAHALWHGTHLMLDAAWGDPVNAAPLVLAQASGVVATEADAEALGLQAAAQLRAGGAA